MEERRHRHRLVVSYNPDAWQKVTPGKRDISRGAQSYPRSWRGGSRNKSYYGTTPWDKQTLSFKKGPWLRVAFHCLLLQRVPKLYSNRRTSTEGPENDLRDGGECDLITLVNITFCTDNFWTSY